MSQVRSGKDLQVLGCGKKQLTAPGPPAGWLVSGHAGKLHCLNFLSETFATFCEMQTPLWCPKSRPRSQDAFTGCEAKSLLRKQWETWGVYTQHPSIIMWSCKMVQIASLVWTGPQCWYGDTRREVCISSQCKSKKQCRDTVGATWFGEQSLENMTPCGEWRWWSLPTPIHVKNGDVDPHTLAMELASLPAMQTKKGMSHNQRFGESSWISPRLSEQDRTNLHSTGREICRIFSDFVWQCLGCDPLAVAVFFAVAWNTALSDPAPINVFPLLFSRWQNRRRTRYDAS